MLGELTATHDGRTLSLGGPRPRAVFALLVVARGAVVTGDRLIDAVWGEGPPPSAVGALQAYVSRLRRELEPARTAGTRRNVIVWEGAGYAIRLAADQVDAWRFEALLRQAGQAGPPAQRAALLTEALALWRGPAFAGFADGPWARAEAARLEELREVVREQLLAARLECGQHTEALLAEAEGLVAGQPLREERWSLLALAHHRAHGRAEALAVLRRARRTLADRLGIDPGPALRGVEAEILSHAPRSAEPLPSAPHTSAPASVAAFESDRLVEREKELAELRQCLADTVAGHGGLVCVQGPAGIGRSALLAEAGRLGREWGVRVLDVGGGPETRAEAAPGSARRERGGGWPGGRGGEQGGERYGEEAGERYGEQGGEQAGEQGGAWHGEQPGEQGGERYGEQAGEWHGEQGGEQAGEQGGGQAGELHGAQGGGQAGGQAGELHGAQGGEVRGSLGGRPREAHDVVRRLLDVVVAEYDGMLPTTAGSMPVLDGRIADRPDGFDVLHGLYRIVERLVTDDHPARRPLLLLVDDLQACDTASLRFLAHLLPRIQNLPVLVVTALRAGEPPARRESEQVLADLAQDPTVVHVRPEPLSAAGVARLVRRLPGGTADEEVERACHRVSAGLPLLLTDVLGVLETTATARAGADPAVAVAESGVRAVSDLVLTVLDRLPPAATAVVRAVAVLDGGSADGGSGEGGASLPAVAAFTDLPEQDVATATAALVRAEVVRDQYPLAFVHPLAGEAVLRMLSPRERPALHERAARLLDRAGTAPERTAGHLLLAPCRGEPWAVGVLRTAAARAAARGAHDTAATLLNRALLEPPTPDVRPAVLLELGRAEALVDGPAAARHLREAYETSSPPRGGAACLLAQTLVYTGRPGEAAEFATRAAAELPTGQVAGQTAAQATGQTASQTVGRTVGQVAGQTLGQATAQVAGQATAQTVGQAAADGTVGDPADERQGLLALARLGAFAHGLYTIGGGTDDPVPPPVGDGPGARMLAAEAARDATARGLDRAAAVAAARFALTDRVLLRSGRVLSWCTAGVVLHLADDDVRLLWEETLTYAGQRGSLIGTLSAHLWNGFTQWRHGELHQARRSLETALEQFGAWGVTPGAPQCRAFLTGVLLDLGDIAGARACLERLRGRTGGAEGARLRGESEARVLIAEGRYAQALAVLDGVRRLQPDVVNPVWWDGDLLRVRALTGLGERDRAVRLAREQLSMARRWGAPGTVGRVLRLCGEARGPDGGPELREALALLADGPARLEHARAQRSLHALAGGETAQDGVVRRFPPA
ncbi:BTAD domain-containing putative transcriptional regulator [Streptomyces sp. NPDC048385]|uniref:BTAD domain-containing putative transcriptional regulator n=1 Tax=Streptomyces sp. NPDC048385 TaxID=3155145 RepID=UPI00342F03BA